MKHIVFFGNSLTAGYGLKNPSIESLPSLVQQKLVAANFDYIVLNFGVSGDTSGGGLDRLSTVLEFLIDIFVLELGANDLLRGYPSAWTKNNLQLIIDQVKFSHPKAQILILGMQLPTWIPGARAAEFRAIYPDLARKNSTALVPFFLEGIAGVKSLNMDDGLHPLAEGYQIIAENIWPFLVKLIPTNENKRV